MDKVIFDTNAYRYLVKDKSFDEIDLLISNLKEKEKKNNIESLFSPIVAQELLAHLANPNDNSYSRCLKANKALYLHSGTDENCPVFPGFEVLLAKIYFDSVPESRIETGRAILQMSYQIATDPTPATFSKLNNNLQRLKESVDYGEQGFIDEMYNFVRRYEPNETDWQIFKNDKKKRQALLAEIRSSQTSFGIAFGYLAATQMVLKANGHIINLTPEQVANMGNHVAETFPEPISLFKQVLENLVNSNFNMTESSRANFVWDIALMFACGKNFIGDSKLYFITSDKAIIAAATKNNSGCFVLTYNEYLEYLGS